jgi:serine/threonine-protein kinase
VSSLDDRTSGVDVPLPAPRPPGPDFGRYRGLGFVGAGGMASVYKAHDPTLGRNVALKFLRGADPEMAARLLVEARAQARIQHPRVCSVYEAGEEDGRPFIAMQFVDGQPLGSARDATSLEEKLAIMKEVAEAVHAAHQVGIIHRDLKPANVMVERAADGAWLPYVMDFGLAREDGGSGLTVTNARLGTPSYMSPEQARGKALDRRSDVYGLGATLYEVLSGRRPFDGDSGMDVLLRVATEEPVPLRALAPSLPADVNTVVMKCLEKEPGRRYDSARALAEDLGRYLAGEPIRARPASVRYRVTRRLRKNRALVGTVAVASLLVLGSLAAFVHARATAREGAALAAEFAEVVKDVEWRMRVAHMAPLHDIRPERALVAERLRHVEERTRRAGGAARGPGEYAMGRGQLALGRPEAARARLEAAWGAGYRPPEAAYALGLALGRLYERERKVADAIGNRELREARRREVQVSLRDPAVGYLRQAQGSDAAPAAYVEGLLAHFEDRPQEALAKAAEAARRAPWFYEARLLAGDVHAALGKKKHETGDAAGSARAVEDAERAYAEAMDLARSDLAARDGLCQIGIQRMEARLYQGGELGPLYETTRAQCEQALAIDPEAPEVHAKLANVHRYWANHLVFRGQEPLPSLDLAAVHARRAIAVDAGNRRAHGNLGIVLRLRAQWERTHGMPWEASLDAALRSLQTAVELAPKSDAGPMNDLANAYVTRANARSAGGGDPRPDLEQADALYARALQAVPEYGYAHANRGGALLDRARHESEHGLDAGPTLERARASLEKAVALLPGLEGTHTLLAEAHLRSAEYAEARGQDAAPAVKRARASMQAASRINPDPGPDLVKLAGDVALADARDRRRRGRPAGEPLAEARRLYAEALRADAGMKGARKGLAEVEALRRGEKAPS